MDRRKDLALAIVFALFGAVLIVISFDLRPGRIEDPLGPRTFPFTTGALIVGISGGLAIRRLRHWGTEGNLIASEAAVEDQAGHPASSVRAYGMWAVLAAYVLILALAGFDIATPVAIGVLLWLMDVRRPALLLGASIGTTVVIHALFIQAFGVRLPLGPLQLLFG